MSDLKNSREAEVSVLGTLMIEPKGFPRVIAIIKPSDFFYPDTKKVFVSMHTLFNKGIEINYQTVLNLFKSESYTGISDHDLREFLDYRVSIETALSFAIQIAEFSGWRALKLGVESLGQEVEKSSLTLTDAAQKLKALSTNINSKGMKDDIVHGPSVVDEYMTMLNRPKDMYKFSGIRLVDEDIYDFNPKELSYIAARPGTGKTTFMLQSAMYNLGKGNRVGFLSMEMERPKLINRMISTYAKISGTRVSRMTTEEFKRTNKLVTALDKISSLPLFIDDTGPWTSETVPQKIRKLVYEYDCNIIYVDYIGLIVGGGDLSSAPRNQQLTRISADLKGLASELSIPILAASQLNRDVEKRTTSRPVLADLRDSGSLEQDASIVAFLYPDMSKQLSDDEVSLYQKNTELAVILEIAKQRNGPVNTYELIFEKSIGRFVSKEEKNATY